MCFIPQLELQRAKHMEQKKSGERNLFPIFTWFMCRLKMMM